MNKITTDIITTTGINISKYDILPSKVFINGIEITDTGTWNKVISSIDVKDKEIDRLNKVLKYLEKHFQEKEEYENAELVRQLKEANIEWLENALGGKE